MAAWDVLESVVEYETGWYTGGYDRVEQPDGTEKRYYWAELPPATVVVAVHEGDVVMVEQYRPTVREHCLELPAGIVEPADGRIENTGGPASPGAYEAAAARELREETGFAAGETTLIEKFWVATGLLRHERGIVAATDLADVDRSLDANEFLTVERVPVEQALDRARDAPANDATLEGLLLAREAGLL